MKKKTGLSKCFLSCNSGVHCETRAFSPKGSEGHSLGADV